MSEMIPFIDLAAQQARIKPRLDAAIQRVLAHGGYIMGPEVRQLEEGLEVFSGAGHCISCANGTDALQMALMALQVGAGDAIITPTFTFAATAEVVALVNATPIMVDVLEETFNIDPASIGRAVGAARDAGLRPAGVIAVDLFGQPADYDLLEAVCAEHDLWLLCDSAQGFGAVYKGRRTGTIGKVTTTSFFPAKPLGCYGDGGAIFTDDDDLAQRLRSIRMHGKGSDKYDNVRIGLNGRLDTLQAAILLEKLEIYADEIEARQRVAARYETALSNLVATPRVLEGATSVWAQYTIRLGGRDRDTFQAALHSAGIPNAIYYPRPLHQQAAYCGFPTVGETLAVSERLGTDVVSLPMHAYLDETTQERVIQAVRDALAK